MNNAAAKTNTAPKNKDYSEYDLRKLDLARKYDDEFSEADGIHLRDHILLVSIGVVMLIFLLWANIATLDEVSRGTGRVIPSKEVQAIQSLEGGIIDEFLVKEGDEVKEGQVLLRIRNIQAKSDFDATMQKYLGLLAATERLQAEADGKPQPEFTDDVKKGAPESVTEEQNAFDANKKQQDSQASVLKDQLSQKQGEVEELQRRIADASSVLKLAQDERNMVAPMVEKGAAAKKELLQIDQKIASQRSELDSAAQAMPRTKAAVEEVKSRLQSQSNDFKASAQKELAEKTIELNTVKQTLAAYRDKSERTEVKSPVHGTVKDLKVFSVGGVAKPGETIMEVVPLEDELIVEANIQPRDIAFIHPGQKAIVRLTAFDFSIYGSLEGDVIEISPDSITNEKGEAFYHVRVKTKQTKLTDSGKSCAGRDCDVTPGMQATVDIVTGHKTVMTYLAKPFIKAAQEAMRER